ncbi:Anthranilate synthase component 2 [bioreactor metagenome]|uniref:Anthranilate synthase component 2 n=1 Tax=bioreactor metagenome TaxID=1076179 RepID=A0A644WCP1_9ZZZZ
MKILLIDNHDSFTFNLVHLLQSFSDVSTDVVTVDQLTLNIAGRYSRIMISPGPGLPSDRPLLKEIILKNAQEASILGVCLGHQAIAEAFGGNLYRITPVLHGITAKVNLLNKNARLFKGLQSGFDAGLYHSWAVSPDDFPEEIEITAVSEKGIIMALQHRKLDIHGVQFHPESIMTPLGKNIISNWLNH